jgi:phage major head subunit gpT-like protein
MAISAVTSKQIIGEFYMTLEGLRQASWVEPFTWMFDDSNEEVEKYRWLGMVPTMRPWGEGRQHKGLAEDGVDITNVHYEASIEVPVSAIRRDKTAQVQTRIRELARRTVTHWNGLVVDVIKNNPTAYDGHNLISGSHGVSNTVSISVGQTDITSPAEAAKVIMGGIQQLLQQEDDQGEPLNEDARSFHVLTPIDPMGYVATAISDRGYGTSNANPLEGMGFDISMSASPRFVGSDLPNASDGGGLVIARTDAEVKPIIRQQEDGTEPELEAVAEGSEHEYENKSHKYGVDTWRGAGPGFYQMICEAYAAS